MLQRERSRKVRLEIELEAEALLSISGAQAYSIALKRSKEASSHEIARKLECRGCDSRAQVGCQLIPARRLIWMNMKNETFVTKAAGGADVQVIPARSPGVGLRRR